MDELKSLARNAKNRLKNGYWTRRKADERTEAERAKGVSYPAFIRAQSRRTRSAEEEVFYEKVKKLADSGAQDPIGQLIDRKMLDGLSYPQRQRYVFSVAEKYRNALADIQSERASAVGSK